MASMTQDQTLFVAILAATFIIVSSPRVYEITSKLLSSFQLTLTRPGMQPTATGLAIHAVVFVSIILGVAGSGMLTSRPF